MSSYMSRGFGRSGSGSSGSSGKSKRHPDHPGDSKSSGDDGSASSNDRHDNEPQQTAPPRRPENDPPSSGSGSADRQGPPQDQTTNQGHGDTTPSAPSAPSPNHPGNTPAGPPTSNDDHGASHGGPLFTLNNENNLNQTFNINPRGDSGSGENKSPDGGTGSGEPGPGEGDAAPGNPSMPDLSTTDLHEGVNGGDLADAGKEWAQDHLEDTLKKAKEYADNRRKGPDGSPSPGGDGGESKAPGTPKSGDGSGDSGAPRSPRGEAFKRKAEKASRGAGKVSKGASVVGEVVGQVPPDLIGKVLEDFSKAAETADELIHAAIDRFNSFVDAMAGALSAAGISQADDLRKAIEAATNQLRQMIDQLASFAKKIMEFTGDPMAIADACRNWVTLGKTGQQTQREITGGALTSEGSWSGPAGEAYRGTLPAQSLAMAGLADTFAGACKSELETWNGELVQYWVTIGVCVADIVAAIAEAIPLCVSVVGIPLAVEEACVQIGMSLATMASETFSLFEQAGIHAAAFKEILADCEAYPGDAWPRSAQAGASHTQGAPGSPTPSQRPTPQPGPPSSAPSGPPGGSGGPSQGPVAPIPSPGGPSKGPAGSGPSNAPSSGGPSRAPSGAPSGSPSAGPSGGPGADAPQPSSGGPSTRPSNAPSDGGPSGAPSGSPSAGPSGGPSADAPQPGAGDATAPSSGLPSPGAPIDHSTHSQGLPPESPHAEKPNHGAPSATPSAAGSPGPGSGGEPGTHDAPQGGGSEAGPQGSDAAEGKDQGKPKIRITDVKRGGQTIHVVQIPDVEYGMSKNGGPGHNPGALAGMVKEAMEADGIKAQEPVLLAGQGHGADAAYSLAADPEVRSQFDVKSLMVSDATDKVAVPSGVSVLDGPGAKAALGAGNDWKSAVASLDSSQDAAVTSWREQNEEFLPHGQNEMSTSTFDLDATEEADDSFGSGQPNSDDRATNAENARNSGSSAAEGLAKPGAGEPVSQGPTPSSPYSSGLNM